MACATPASTKKGRLPTQGSSRPACQIHQARLVIRLLFALRFCIALAAPAATTFSPESIPKAGTLAAGTSRSAQLRHVDFHFFALERFKLLLLVGRQLGHQLL